MIWIILSTLITSLLSLWFGYKRLLHIHDLSIRNVLVSITIGILTYSIMLYLFKVDLLSEAVSGAIITNVYASIFGFFSGAALNQYQIRTKSGKIVYVHRSFISEYVPVIIALALILFSLYRSGLLTDLAITPIRVTSGLSFLGIGLWGITLRLVPEFREQGIILLDTCINWENLINYQWFSEVVLEIEYELEGSIKHFKTLIPPEDQPEVERLLSKKMREKVEEF
ncbi:MAG: hypothetical protein ED557_01505 [Balneola sp.]|nr:MAG: hypothetical protein ED557_01505 [Balneola sp.]